MFQTRACKAMKIEAYLILLSLARETTLQNFTAMLPW
jgi:hypothetical protein